MTAINVPPATKSDKSESTKSLVIGVIFPSKKIDHLRNILDEERHQIRFQLIDLTDDIREPRDLVQKYGHLDALLHKLAHDMVYAQNGDTNAHRRVKLIELYSQTIGQKIPIIDALQNVQSLTDRQRVCEILQKLASEKAQNADFCVSKYRVVSSAEDFCKLKEAIENQSLRLPLIAKSIEACASERSHFMSVITQSTQLQLSEHPLLYQEFINHSGRLFKGYVLGDRIQVAERTSLPNMTQDCASIGFDTQKKYPTASEMSTLASVTAPYEAKSSPSQNVITQRVEAIGRCIQKRFNVSLFGFDVIISDEDGAFYVIDVNYFPSYKEMDDFDSALRQHIHSVIRTQTS